MKQVRITPVLDYRPAVDRRRARTWMLGCALVLPTLIECAFFMLADRAQRCSVLANWSVVAVGLALGAALMAGSRLRARAWLPLLLLYIPIQILWLGFVGLLLAISSGDSL
jgi:hypothetical protein